MEELWGQVSPIIPAPLIQGASALLVVPPAAVAAQVPAETVVRIRVAQVARAARRTAVTAETTVLREPSPAAGPELASRLAPMAMARSKSLGRRLLFALERDEPGG